MASKRTWSPVAVTSKYSCSIDGVTYKEVHFSFLIGVFMVVSWSLSRLLDVVWNHQISLQWRSVRLQHSFSLFSNLHNSFRAYKLVGCLFACLCTNLRMNYSYNTNNWCFSLEMIALLLFLILMLELYFLIFFSHLPSIFLLQQFEKIHLDYDDRCRPTPMLLIKDPHMF